MIQDFEKQKDTENHLLDKLSVGAVSSRLNVYEYIWSKVFPNEELNYDDFYDWSRENANKALELALEYCDLGAVMLSLPDNEDIEKKAHEWLKANYGKYKPSEWRAFIEAATWMRELSKGSCS